MTLILSGSDGVTFPDSTEQETGYANGIGFRNRIINGDMRIDQRNAGASVTLTSNGYLVDRWSYYVDQTSKATAQQSSTTATEFTNSLLITSSSAYSVLSGDQFIIQQSIEGLNVPDLAWGTANAKTVTLSFWVRSSLTGTFGGSIVNSGQSRSYPFTYSISSANTFEYKTITIPGDTSGTWLTTNGIGIRVYFGLGVGATNSGTAGTWAGTYYSSATGATSVVGTNGATFYITGVQLEVGSVATPFERRPYGTELSLCQRYYYSFVKGNSQNIGIGGYYNSSYLTTSVNFPVSMRAAPSLIQATGSNFYGIYANNTLDTFNSFDEGIQQPTVDLAGLDVSSNVSGTAGHAGRLITNDASASIAFSSEL